MDLLETLVVARTGDIGGFAVRRALPSVKRRMVGPFVFLDQMGPAEFIIGHGLDVKVVQTRLRHASAMTTLNTYGHLWPDADESARAAVGSVLAARADSSRTDAR